MAESWHSQVFRWFMNFHPTYRGTGGWLTYIAANWREIRVKLPLSWQTRNYVGTIFGGSMYSAIDPIYMIMLINCLGDEYIVWDKAATIRFKKPGKSTLYAHFVITDEELVAIRAETAQNYSVDRIYMIELVDADGVAHATIEKTLYIRRKDAIKPEE
jgi:acyl-coenzyme A thioesterase PaaI-like protein